MVHSLLAEKISSICPSDCAERTHQCSGKHYLARYYLGLYQLVASERTDLVWRRDEERGHVEKEAK